MPSKVMKYQLYYVDGSSGDFSFVQQSLWGLMRDSREILNKTIQYCVQWDFKDRLHYEETGEHLDIVAETGKKRLDGHIYSLLNGKYTICNSHVLVETIKRAFDKHKSSRNDVIKGMMSVPSYKSDQPISVPARDLKGKIIRDKDSNWVVSIPLFSKSFKKENNLKSNPVFSIQARDKTQKTILERIESGSYSVGASQLVYRKKKWFLYLTYTFESRETALDPEKILGVDLGVAYVLYASTKGVYGGFSIQGREAHVRPDGRKVKTNVLEYAEQLEQQTWDRQKQARYCGEGRIGHGTRKRLEPVYQAGKRLANHRDTLNHRWSKALVEYALKTGCGTIQMEDLTGIKEDTGFPKMLRHWTYYDLQQKIEYKAEEKGIKVVKVNPKYTSQRCSQCGYIDKGNRPDQKTFQCLKCGFKHNADYNASQNLSIKNIDTIIAKELKKKGEPQADTE